MHMIGKWFLPIVCPKKFWGTLNKATIQKLVEQTHPGNVIVQILKKKKMAGPPL